MNLPELAAEAAPQFVDAASCKAWLQDVPLANVGAAQDELRRELREYNRFPSSAVKRLEVMEALREAVHFVQIEQAKRFSSRALPATDAESAIFEATIALWDEMRLGYQRLLEAALGGDPAVRPQAALICQRAIAYGGLKMFHHYRAYREVPAREWRALHAAYAGAEKLEAAEEAVQDFLNRDVHESSPRIAYAHAVLMELCSPNELAQRQLAFVAYLLERWAAKLEVSPAPLDEGLGVPPLVADLEKDRCPERIAEADAKLIEPRYLDTRKLAKSLRNRVALLRKGESPARLGLGEDCVQPSCEQLLVFLYRQWCQAKPARAPGRQAADAIAQADIGLEAIYQHVSGRAFRQPVGASELTQKQRDEIATFGRVISRDDGSAQAVALDDWEVEEESAQGLRLVRRAGREGKRVAHGQLMLVRPRDAKSFMLGQVRWLMAAQNGELHAGLRLLPGVPSAVAVRPTGLNAQNEKYLPALVLGAVPALDAPPSLVLPPGWFKPKRVIETYADGASRVRLTEVLERGSDFERVGYEPGS